MILAFDIGGTKIASGLVCPDTWTVHQRATTVTPNHHNHPEASRDEILAALLGCLQAEWRRCSLLADISDCFVAFPAALDPDGFAHVAPTVWGNLPGPAIDVRKLLEPLWPQVQTHVLNDVAASGFAYVADGHKDFAIFTIGSGVGCKTFIDGRCITGPRGRGGEIGHLRVDSRKDAPVCDCGSVGHLGAVASGRGLLNLAKRIAAEDDAERVIDPALITNEDLVAAFEHNVPWAIKTVDRGARYLGQVLAGLHLTVGLEDFVFMGGMAHALGDRFFNAIAKHAEQSCWDDGGDWSQWVGEMPMKDSALVGGAYFARSAARRVSPDWPGLMVESAS
ncbi:MAG: ROK family protein [Pseudomonadota bacterium]